MYFDSRDSTIHLCTLIKSQIRLLLWFITTLTRLGGADLCPYLTKITRINQDLGNEQTYSLHVLKI